MSPTSTKDLKLYEKEVLDESDNSPTMPLSIHLDELRNKIIFSLIALCLVSLISFSSSKEMIKLLTNIAPQGTAFLQIKPGEFFFTSLRVAIFCGLGTTSPIIIWQLGSFILPGLTTKEKKATILILSFAPILFGLGSVFAYYFVAPSMLKFLFGFGAGVIPSSISIENFISFTLMIMAICGFTFLLPVVIFALANVGIVDSKVLINKWRHAILLSLILGAVLTPTPDPFNMGLVSGILVTLYFLSWGILRVVGK